MKKTVSLLLILSILFTFFGCSSSFSEVQLNEPIAIPDNGIIEKSSFSKLKENKTIGVFYGENNGYRYEWTVFGSDLKDIRDINFSVSFEPFGAEDSSEGFAFALHEKKDLGFPAVLSVTLKEKWDADSAAVYKQDGNSRTPLCSASVTGSKETIINFSVNRIFSKGIVVPEKVLTENNKTESEKTSSVPLPNKQDSYLSSPNQDGNRVYSDGTQKGQDKYETDPVPEGKPMPVEPEDGEINKSKTYTCTISIECSSILNNISKLNPDKLEMVPSDGIILPPAKVKFYEGESVFDVLQRVCRENKIHMESSWTPMYNSAYVEGINNLYEFDCGNLSGWMYRVNGWYPNYGCSRYQLREGDIIEWRYTCDLGRDIGDNRAG